MRSVFFPLKGTTREKVSLFISTIAENDPAPHEGWIAQPGLYFRFYDELAAEDDDGSLRAALMSTLGQLPDVCVSIDISGRIQGYVEACALAEAFLGRFTGVAFDDHSVYCWTLEEIRSDARPEGRKFFHGTTPVGRDDHQ